MRDPAIVPAKFDKILKRGRARDPRHCSSFCSHNGREIPGGRTMYLVYILKSIKTGRYYIGSSSNLESRLKEHNSGGVKSTKAYRPWAIIHEETFSDKHSAYRRERQIKRFKHGEAFLKLLNQS